MPKSSVIRVFMSGLISWSVVDSEGELRKQGLALNARGNNLEPATIRAQAPLRSIPRPAEETAQSMPDAYKLYAHIGSPYSMKIRALLRYRRIRHVVLGRMSDFEHAFAQVRVPVMPVLEYPDGTFHNDSTPLLLDLERRHEGRSVVPEREADAFLAFLIEDLADEWLTKAMYAYRWAYPEHTGWTGRLIAYDQSFGGGVEALEQLPSSRLSAAVICPPRRVDSRLS